MSDENRSSGSDRDSRGSDSQDRGSRPSRPSGPRSFYKKKICKVCANKLRLDYKEPETLRRFMTERGKILPRRITGTCAKHQRALAGEIKKSRTLALLPFVAN